jgi:3-deoxy-D-manno-octulosonic-acid transferase
LDAVAAVSDADAARLQRLGVRRDRTTTLGDPRMDSVLETVSCITPDDPLLSLGDPSSTLVAGSTWPSDEQVLLPAYVAVRRRRPDARLVMVPHRPTFQHLERSESLAQRLGLPAPVRLSRRQSDTPFLLVDRLGVLATLYGAGGLTYVGGGFHRRGLHSVMEPAGWARPVIVGPRWNQSADAEKLLAAGGARSVGSVAELSEAWLHWLNDGAAGTRAGHAAREVVEAGSGAADRLAALVEQLVTSAPRPRR